MEIKKNPRMFRVKERETGRERVVQRWKNKKSGEKRPLHSFSAVFLRPDHNQSLTQRQLYPCPRSEAWSVAAYVLSLMNNPVA